MKAAIYNPYLDTLGGGERYSLAVANLLSGKGFKVDVQWDKESIREKLEVRFGIDLKNVDFVKDIKRGDGYEVCFWVSDGSVPLLRSRNNLLHFQVPFTNVDGKSLMNKMKLFRINHVVCNSKFTKGFIDKEFGVKSVVVYPPVDTESIKPRRKKKMILSVGRFSQLKQAKRQDVLVKVFKKMCDKGLKDWRLVLAGGSEVGAGEYVERLKKMADGYPIEIVEGPKYQKLLEYYGKSKIFWSASGYGVDEKKDPGGVEHFGISVVEAMAAKSVPVVFGAGGYKEIVSDGKDGLLWKNMRQLMKITQRIIKDSKELMQISERALSKSDDYSYANFERRLEAIV